MAEENAEKECPKCPDCPPAGLPGWMGTFADLVTLLLTFFVLLLSFAKTETAKYEAALGSIRNAFGGNVLKHGEVVMRGKSADDSPTMMESPQAAQPFPIEFLTTEGLLQKREINRFSAEQLKEMRELLRKYNLSHSVKIEEVAEGIKVNVVDKIYFKEGTTEIRKISIEVFDRVVQLLKNENWVVFVEGHSSLSEVSLSGDDAYALSSLRAMIVLKTMIKRGVRREQISAVFYGDSRPFSGNQEDNRRVEFMIRKVDLRAKGRKVRSQ